MKAILKYCSSHQPLALKCLAVADMCRIPVESVMTEDVKQITFNQGLSEHFLSIKLTFFFQDLIYSSRVVPLFVHT